MTTAHSTLALPMPEKHVDEAINRCPPPAPHENMCAFNSALDALTLPAYSAEAERGTAISAAAGLFVTLRNIDAALSRARSILVVLQPNRDGRVDLRTVKHRAIEGARDYALIEWVGGGPRQYARKLPLQSAHKHVSKGARGSRRPYTMARTLTRRIAGTIEVRRKVIAAILAMRRVRRVVDNSPAPAALANALAEFNPVALTMLAVYSSSPIGQAHATNSRPLD